MPPRKKDATLGEEAVRKPPPRSRMKLFDKDELKKAIEPLAGRLPSTKPAAEPEALPPEPATLDDCADRIKSLWADAQQRLLDIGELLDWAERQFKAGGQFIAWIDASLPFKRGAAYQILKAARALRSGIVPHEVAPAGYTAVYLASTLTPEERQLALDKGVIRPDMRRQDLVAFKRSLRALPQATDERATLEAEEKRLLAKLAEVRARIAALA